MHLCCLLASEELYHAVAETKRAVRYVALVVDAVSKTEHPKKYLEVAHRTTFQMWEGRGDNRDKQAILRLNSDADKQEKNAPCLTRARSSLVSNQTNAIVVCLLVLLKYLTCLYCHYVLFVSQYACRLT